MKNKLASFDTELGMATQATGGYQDKQTQESIKRKIYILKCEFRTHPPRALDKTSLKSMTGER